VRHYCYLIYFFRASLSSLLVLALLFVQTNLYAASTKDTTAKTMSEGLAAVERQDYMTAFTVFKQLANKGDKEAQYNLAILYKQGDGIMQNRSKAASWFRKSADQGLPAAQYRLARMYDIGDGVEQNFDYAAVWYQKAAEQGDPLAQTNLGVLYANGEGLKQDLVLAYVWLNLAASQGLALALDNRELIAKSMSKEMLAKVRLISRDYFQKYVEPHLVTGGNLRTGVPKHLHPKMPTPTSKKPL